MEKLLKIQSELKANKSRRNDFGGFNYRSAEDILEAVKPLLEANNCLLTLSDKVVSIGERYYVEATATLCDIETKECFTTSAFAREAESKKGQDESQITGSASSYARKYALNGLFLIDDSKQDPDSNEQTKRRNEAAEDYEQKIGPKDAAKIKGLLEATGADVPAFLEYFHVKSVEEMTGSQYVEAVYASEEREQEGERSAERMSNEIIVVDKETGEITMPEQIVKAIHANEVAIRDAKKANEEFKARLLEAMEEYGVEKIQSDYFTVSYVGAHETIRLDPKEVQEKYPRVHAECSHVSPVKASVRVRLK